MMTDAAGLNPALEASANRDFTKGMAKITTGAGFTQLAPVVIDPGDVVGAALIVSGAKDMAKGAIKYAISKAMSPSTTGATSPSPSPAPGPSPKPPCDDDDRKERLYRWQGGWWRPYGHFDDRLEQRTDMDPLEFQAFITKANSRKGKRRFHAPTGHYREEWSLGMKGAGAGERLMLIVELNKMQSSDGRAIEGYFVTTWIH